MRERLEPRCVGREAGGGHAGWEEGSRGLLAAYLSIVAIFFETASVVHCESTSALKKRKPWNINILISCAWQRA